MGTRLGILSCRRSKVHCDDEHGAVSPEEQSASGYVCQPCSTSKLVTAQEMLEPLGAIRRTRMTPTEWKWTLFEKARARAKENVNSRMAVADMWMQTRVSIAASPDIGRKTARSQAEERLTAPPVVSPKAKARQGKSKGQNKGKTMDVAQKNISFGKSLSSYASLISQSIPSQSPSVIDASWCNSGAVGRARRLDFDLEGSMCSGKEYLLLDSCAQIPACPIDYPGESVVDRPWSPYRDERSEFFLCRNPFFPSVVLQNEGIGVILALTRAPCIFQTTVRFHCTMKAACFSSKLISPLTATGVSDDVAQELQMPIGPQAVSDVEEPMPSRPATLRDPVNSRSNRCGTAQVDAFSESTLVQRVRRIQRARLSTS